MCSCSHLRANLCFHYNHYISIGIIYYGLEVCYFLSYVLIPIILINSWECVRKSIKWVIMTSSIHHFRKISSSKTKTFTLSAIRTHQRSQVLAMIALPIRVIGSLRMLTTARLSHWHQLSNLICCRMTIIQIWTFHTYIYYY